MKCNRDEACPVSVYIYRFNSMAKKDTDDISRILRENRLKLKQLAMKDTVQWYVLSAPRGCRDISAILNRENVFRNDNDISPLEFFAPTYVREKSFRGRQIRVTSPLALNYVFVHSSQRDIAEMMTRIEKFHFLPSVVDGDGIRHYPYIKDEQMQNFMWIAKTYSNELPAHIPDMQMLAKGDRIRITKGDFAGCEATLITTPGSKYRKIEVALDKFLSVPLLTVPADGYVLLELNEDLRHQHTTFSLGKFEQLHEALGRVMRSGGGDGTEKNDCHNVECGNSATEANGSGETVDMMNATDEDKRRARVLINQISQINNDASDWMRCKRYAFLAAAYTILGDDNELRKTMETAKSLVAASKLNEGKIFLCVVMYGCTNNAFYYEKAHTYMHQLDDKTKEKKSYASILRFLNDYDSWYGHVNA